MAETETDSKARRRRLPVFLRLPQRRGPDRRIEVSPNDVYQPDGDGTGPRATLEGLMLRYALLSGAVIIVSVVLAVIALVWLV